LNPETRYARSSGVSIAYQVVGDGPVDLVFVPGWVSNVEYGWEDPAYGPFLERLARFSRLIVLDRRGTGLSDPVEQLPGLEERMDDVRAVMDAAGSERAFLVGVSEGGPMCALFASTFPERTAGLVLVNTFARGTRDDSYPWMMSKQTAERWLEVLGQKWGTGMTAGLFAPSRAGEEAFVASLSRFERRSVSPSGIQKIVRMLVDTDIREILPSIHVPTLVIHRAHERAVRVENGRYLAEHIAGARLVEVAGIDHFPWVGEADPILGEIEEFATGHRQSAEVDRVLATVLFIDIVDSTRAVAERGDRQWRGLLEQFYAVLGQEIGRGKGRLIKTTGDGVLATFDGPARAVRSALAACRAVQPLGIAIRAGLHTGECELLGDDVAGIAVHVGARVGAAAGPGEVLVSSTVKDLVAGSGLRFTDRGEHTLKGVPGEWRLFAAEG
jgi:pimeloyl-ACP methyl ester carboxylesterase/class 3 adenylate cyclase